MKKCPFCAEEIQDEAIVCRYCNRDLLPPKPQKYKTGKMIFHYCNENESGWYNANMYTKSTAAASFWINISKTANAMDEEVKSTRPDVEFIGPRDPTCLNIGFIRAWEHPVLSGAIFRASDVNLEYYQYRQFPIYWVKSFSLGYRMPVGNDESEENYVFHLWWNPKINYFSSADDIIKNQDDAIYLSLRKCYINAKDSWLKTPAIKTAKKHFANDELPEGVILGVMGKSGIIGLWATNKRLFSISYNKGETRSYSYDSITSISYIDKKNDYPASR